MIIGELSLWLEGDPRDGDQPEEVKKKVQAIIDDVKENTGLPWGLDGEIDIFNYTGGRFNVSANLVIEDPEEDNEP